MALGWLGDFLGINRGEGTRQASRDNRQIIDDYAGRGRDIIGQGRRRSQGYLNDALDLTGMRGSTLYGDAIGANGQGGSARARDAFQFSPGYQFNLDQGNQALDRRAAAAGRFSSGNADIDAMTFSQGLASQEWNGWLDRITGANDRAMGIYRDMAGNETGYADRLLGHEGQIATGYMGANNQDAAGREAGQGGLWSLLGNVAGVAGAAMGVPQIGGGMGGAPGGGVGNHGPAQPPRIPAFGGYGAY
ncbi:MAG: hypothetical protein K0R44_1425 [Thermomicrobiales bacterium]|jgi:hypothetical protein|nr:hypothetical protein [Thermomicrobiales bacterium]